MKSEREDLLKENQLLKRRLEELEKADNLEDDKPQHHSYGSMLILMLIQMRIQGNCSLRSCLKTMKIVLLTLGIELQLPCVSTLLNWEKKIRLRPAK